LIGVLKGFFYSFKALIQCFMLITHADIISANIIATNNPYIQKAILISVFIG